MKLGSRFCFIVLMLFLFIGSNVFAQLSAPGADASDQTNYPAFPETDSIYIFCVEDEFVEDGVLRVETTLEGTKTFLWEKYNNETAGWEFYFSESIEPLQSTISSLASGGYRVTITQGATTEIHRAWVFNNWLSAAGEVTVSNCDYFQMTGSFSSGAMIYFDPSDNTQLDVFKDVKVEWTKGEEFISSVLTPQVFDPPTQDTEYDFRVYDRFGCETTATVLYESIVTKADFSVDPQEGEAPLEVTFTNQSENGDPGFYQWFFYRDLDDIKRESENSEEPVDSIDFIAIDDNVFYTFENSGTYNIKLVSRHVSDSLTCVDTTYIEDYIVVDTSFVVVPNVFTPNGDGTNDNFVVKFWSMRSIKISIFSRWGKRIHFWESGDVRGFENTWEETVWDGRLGGRWASPGVYYYTVEGTGRDDKKRRKHGFFHLFRDKR